MNGPPRVTWAPVLATLALVVALLWLGYELGWAYTQHLYS